MGRSIRRLDAKKIGMEPPILKAFPASGISHKLLSCILEVNHSLIANWRACRKNIPIHLQWLLFEILNRWLNLLRNRSNHNSFQPHERQTLEIAIEAAEKWKDAQEELIKSQKLSPRKIEIAVKKYKKFVSTRNFLGSEGDCVPLEFAAELKKNPIPDTMIYNQELNSEGDLDNVNVA